MKKVKFLKGDEVELQTNDEVSTSEGSNEVVSEDTQREKEAQKSGDNDQADGAFGVGQTIELDF